MLLFHLPDTVKAEWDDGDLEVLGKQAYAWLERKHVRRGAIIDDAFGEDQQAVPMIDRFAGKTKAFAEAGELWERENVEK